MQTPILFVHGNGDTAALWLTTIWRFASNGYSRERLFAYDFTDPQARLDDAVPMADRSGSADQLRELTAFIAHARSVTGAERIALVASSRGANAVRNFIRSNGDERVISHVVLCGGVNHGVFAWPTFNPGSEFNALGPFMRVLNAPYPDGIEVAPGVRWMTIRSDNFDKYAQPDGRFLERPEVATNVTYEGPALRGAENVVLPGADHRELAFGPAAFDRMYHFITGAAPTTLDIEPEADVTLSGKVTGYSGEVPTNRPLSDAVVTIYQVDAKTGARMRTAPYRVTTGPDGNWGPLVSPADAALEFVIAASGYPITHIYRSPFPRSSPHVHLRPRPPNEAAVADGVADSVVMISRPRGYFGDGRDQFEIDGRIPDGITAGVPGVSTATMRLPASPRRSISTRFNGECIAVINWPAVENRIVVAEFHY